MFVFLLIHLTQCLAPSAPSRFIYVASSSRVSFSFYAWVIFHCVWMHNVLLIKLSIFGYSGWLSWLSWECWDKHKEQVSFINTYLIFFRVLASSRIELVLLLVFWGASMMYSITEEKKYIHCNSIWELSWFHSWASTHYYYLLLNYLNH